MIVTGTWQVFNKSLFLLFLPKRRYVALRGSEFAITRDVQAEEGQSLDDYCKGRQRKKGRRPGSVLKEFSG